jgi:hypothetical protein
MQEGSVWLLRYINIMSKLLELDGSVVTGYSEG